MKRFVLLAIVLLAYMSAHAQLRVVELHEEADTLIYTTRTGAMSPEELIDLYKNDKGYLIKVKSTNMFDATPSFYLGKTKEEARKTLEDLIQFCEKDVDTSAIVKDAEDEIFLIETTYMANHTRKVTFVKSDRLYVKNKDMAGWMCLKQKIMEDALKFLK